MKNGMGKKKIISWWQVYAEGPDLYLHGWRKKDWEARLRFYFCALIGHKLSTQEKRGRLTYKLRCLRCLAETGWLSIRPFK